MITVKAEDVARIMGNALAHAGRDDTLPVLAAVRLECDGGTLTAVGTDRYSLGMDTAALVEGDDNWSFLIGYSDVPRLVKVCKEHAKAWRNVVGGPTVTLTVEDNRLTLDVPGQQLTVTRVEGEFPRYRSLIPDTAGEGDGPTRIALTASNLTKITKVITETKNEPLRFYLTTAAKPVVVRAGTFVGLLMPCRIDWEAHDAKTSAAA